MVVYLEFDYTNRLNINSIINIKIIMKLMSGGDKSFKILERINDNVYNVDLPSNYGANVTFNIFYHFLFDVGDNLWMKLFKEKGDNMIKTIPKDSLQVSIGVNYKIKGKEA
jgi:hypothetical protein